MKVDLKSVYEKHFFLIFFFLTDDDRRIAIETFLFLLKIFQINQSEATHSNSLPKATLLRKKKRTFQLSEI